MELFFFIIPAYVPHQLVSSAGKHLSILVDPLSVPGRKLNAFFEDQERFMLFNRAVLDRIYPHLFKEETGVPFTQYLKWLKTMEAVKHACLSGRNLTETAHMAGFSDSAHLSRTFKEMFGLVPSSVFCNKNSRFIQARSRAVRL